MKKTKQLRLNIRKLQLLLMVSLGIFMLTSSAWSCDSPDNLTSKRNSLPIRQFLQELINCQPEYSSQINQKILFEIIYDDLNNNELMQKELALNLREKSIFTLMTILFNNYDCFPKASSKPHYELVRDILGWQCINNKTESLSSFEAPDEKVSPQVAATLPNPTDIPMTKVEMTRIKIAAISGANMRATANNRAKIIAALPLGTVIQLLGYQNSWAKVALVGGGKTGYIHKRLIVPDQPIPTGWFRVRPVKGVNLRKSPSISSDIITKIKKNITVSVVKATDDWVFISLPNRGLKGYI
ncbi:MAG: SH3 domain-containing protein [Magnetococcales bacterium]|nr:SH3 domain-containing protein [Magnetococcales bacterium]